jgi:hypothetical protein
MSAEPRSLRRELLGSPGALNRLGKALETKSVRILARKA